MIKIREGVNLLDLLSGCGFTAYELRKQHIFGEKTIQKLRKGGLPSWNELNFICTVANLQPADIIEFERDKQPVKFGYYQTEPEGREER